MLVDRIAFLVWCFQKLWVNGIEIVARNRFSCEHKEIPSLKAKQEWKLLELWRSDSISGSRIEKRSNLLLFRGERWSWNDEWLVIIACCCWWWWWWRTVRSRERSCYSLVGLCEVLLLPRTFKKASTSSKYGSFVLRCLDFTVFWFEKVRVTASWRDADTCVGKEGCEKEANWRVVRVETSRLFIGTCTHNGDCLYVTPRNSFLWANLLTCSSWYVEKSHQCSRALVFHVVTHHWLGVP